MNAWIPATLAELKEDAEFSQNYIKSGEFLDSLDLKSFVENWELFLFTNCYFEKNNWFMHIDGQTVNITKLYKTTWSIYEHAKEILIITGDYKAVYWGFEKVSHNKDRAE